MIGCAFAFDIAREYGGQRARNEHIAACARPTSIRCTSFAPTWRMLSAERLGGG
jgi:hypothetical protein